MTYYQKELIRIKDICYHNKGQINVVIGTRHYINSHFDNALNLDMLSHNLFTSKFHLLRIFKRYYGQTPIQYLIEKRLERAKELLLKRVSIADTCYEIGFESPSSFSTLFKARFGQTPSTFQKRAIFAKSNGF